MMTWTASDAPPAVAIDVGSNASAIFLGPEHLEVRRGDVTESVPLANVAHARIVRAPSWMAAAIVLALAAISELPILGTKVGFQLGVFFALVTVLTVTMRRRVHLELTLREGASIRVFLGVTSPFPRIEMHPLAHARFDAGWRHLRSELARRKIEV